MCQRCWCSPLDIQLTELNTCNQFMEDACRPCVVCTTFDFAVDQQGTARDLSLFMKPKRCSTSAVSTVSLLIDVEKQTLLIRLFFFFFFWSRRLTTTWAIIVHYSGHTAMKTLSLIYAQRQLAFCDIHAYMTSTAYN